MGLWGNVTNMTMVYSVVYVKTWICEKKKKVSQSELYKRQSKPFREQLKWNLSILTCQQEGRLLFNFLFIFQNLRFTWKYSFQWQLNVIVRVILTYLNTPAVQSFLWGAQRPGSWLIAEVLPVKMSERSHIM